MKGTNTKSCSAFHGFESVKNKMRFLFLRMRNHLFDVDRQILLVTIYVIFFLMI